jgi:RNA-binding protein PNO1
MKMQIRMNTKRKCVEIKTSEYTQDKNAIQKGCDFLKAFMLGFDLNDAIAMLRLDDLFIESFQVKDGNSFRNV